MCDTEANATHEPVLLVEGPTVGIDNSLVVLVQLVKPSQIPRVACVASAARSKITGKPSSGLGFTENGSELEVPPPGALFTTSTFCTPPYNICARVSVVVAVVAFATLVGSETPFMTIVV